MSVSDFNPFDPCWYCFYFWNLLLVYTCIREMFEHNSFGHSKVQLTLSKNRLYYYVVYIPRHVIGKQ